MRQTITYEQLCGLLNQFEEYFYDAEGCNSGAIGFFSNMIPETKQIFTNKYKYTEKVLSDYVVK